MNVDMMGNEVNVGDYVAVPDGNLRLIFAVVVKLNPKTMKVKEVKKGTKAYVKQIPYGHFIKLDQDLALIKAFSAL